MKLSALSSVSNKLLPAYCPGAGLSNTIALLSTDPTGGTHALPTKPSSLQSLGRCRRAGAQHI